MTDREGEALQTWAVGMDQPLGDPSVLPTWRSRASRRARARRAHGRGGDEPFGGYPTLPRPSPRGFLRTTCRARSPRRSSRSRGASARSTTRHDRAPARALLGVRGLSPFEHATSRQFGTARADIRWRCCRPGSGDERGDALPHAPPRERARRHTNPQSPAAAAGIARVPGCSTSDLPVRRPAHEGGPLHDGAHGVRSRAAPFLRGSLIEFALALLDAAQAARHRAASGRQAGRRRRCSSTLLAAPQAGLLAAVLGVGAHDPLRGIVFDDARPRGSSAPASRRARVRNKQVDASDGSRGTGTRPPLDAALAAVLGETLGRVRSPRPAIRVRDSRAARRARGVVQAFSRLAHSAARTWLDTARAQRRIAMRARGARWARRSPSGRRARRSARLSSVLDAPPPRP